jgi:hypothetical protein
VTYKKSNKILERSLIAYLPLSTLMFAVLFFKYSDTQNLIILDDTTVTIHESSPKTVKKETFKYIARNAAESFLNRNPNGLDKQLDFRQLYTGEAYKKAMDQFEAEKVQFDEYDIHQKAEIFPFNILQSSGERIFMQIPGQLLRNLKVDGMKKTYTLTFQLDVELHRNYNLKTNGKYPYAVKHMKYSQKILD